MARKSDISCFLILLLGFLLSSCSSEKPDIGRPSQQEGVRPVSQVAPQAPAERADSSSPPGSEESTKNSPPVFIRAQLKPENVDNTDVLRAVAEATDKDGDEVTFQYECFKNSEPAGNSNSLTGFKKGDRILVKIVPYDGKDYGQPKNLSVQIGNRSPRIVEQREILFDGKTYTFQIKAVDPDGDRVTYALKSAPPGMTINPSTGLFQWNVPLDFEGKAPITISITDGQGGEIEKSYNLEIRSETK